MIVMLLDAGEKWFRGLNTHFIYLSSIPTACFFLKGLLHHGRSYPYFFERSSSLAVAYSPRERLTCCVVVEELDFDRG